MKLSGIKVLENEGEAVPNRTQRPQSETVAVNVYVGNGRRWSEGSSDLTLSLVTINQWYSGDL